MSKQQCPFYTVNSESNVAIVNGRNISTSEFKSWCERNSALNELRDGFKELRTNSYELCNLSEYVDTILLDHAAQMAQVLTSAELGHLVDRAISGYSTSDFVGSSPGQIKKMLAAKIRSAYFLYTRVFQDLKVSSEEVQEYFRDHVRPIKPNSLYNIMYMQWDLAIPSSEGDAADALTRLEQEPQAFKKISEQIKGLNSSFRTGYLYFVPFSALYPEIEVELRKLKKGEQPPLIRTRNSIYLIRIDAVSKVLKSGLDRLETARISKVLMLRKRDAVRQDLLDQLHRESQVKIFPHLLFQG